ncbi:helix-hairpin-helix domain-containing protein [Maridesulfovibrio sp.]|jgi:hypothetical protein|uniref:helix-hairpin-helix domain-containing protein n=1 Tax=Maridesulfovibrio sp. TaxID=2795000 RepID=UPI0029CA31AC|nr:helix-hairpin-helix domain-containing protein [Maridesulfovibrio sp.]
MINADPAILKQFQTIPGVGSSIAKDLWNLGYRSLSEIRDENPDDMYERLEELAGCHVDRCMLYVFRCAVYCVSNEYRDPELEKWWNWKD